MVQVIRKTTDAGKKLEIALKNLEGKVGKVGWFKDSQYENGIHVAYVAAIQEYGYPPGNIPERPFMRPTIMEKKNEWKELALSGSRSILKGNATIAIVMEALGLRAAGQVRAMISAILVPPLSPITIAARLRKRANKKVIGSLTKPLIDTGLMLNSLTNTVENE